MCDAITAHRITRHRRFGVRYDSTAIVFTQPIRVGQGVGTSGIQLGGFTDTCAYVRKNRRPRVGTPTDKNRVESSGRAHSLSISRICTLDHDHGGFLWGRRRVGVDQFIFVSLRGSNTFPFAPSSLNCTCCFRFFLTFVTEHFRILRFFFFGDAVIKLRRLIHFTAYDRQTPAAVFKVSSPSGQHF